MTKTKILALIGFFSFLVLVFSISCTKNPITPPPVHDTVTVVKHDTTLTRDTIIGIQPDPTVDLNKGLLLYLPFTGNANDSSGNNNLTTSYGSVLTADAHGWANSAFGAYGDGSTEVFVTNNGSIKFDTAFSISFGFMVNDTNATQSFISMVNPTNGYAASFNLGLIDPTTNYFSFGVGDVSSSCNSIVANHVIDTTRFTPVPGSWYKCICIYYRGGVQVYMNGVLVGSKQSQLTQAINCPDAKVVIGGWWNDGNRLNINGKIDNVRMYDRVLTPHEITLLSTYYQVTSNQNKPGLKTH